MKKVSLIFSVLCAFAVSYGFAQEQQSMDGDNYAQQSIDGNYGQSFAGCDMGKGVDNCCQPREKPCGDCYCLYCKYEPCYYNKWRCEYCPKYCYKKCCRYVPQYYQKQCCRYVPQYYYQTCCRQVPQYYYTCSCHYVPKWRCERCCKYVPKYYYKHVCQPTCAPESAPTCVPTCGPSGCGVPR